MQAHSTSDQWWGSRNRAGIGEAAPHTAQPVRTSAAEPEHWPCEAQVSSNAFLTLSTPTTAQLWHAWRHRGILESFFNVPSFPCRALWAVTCLVLSTR